MAMEFESIFNAILDGDSETVKAEVQAALAAGGDPKAILTEGMVTAMDKVGKLFEEGDYFVPEMLISARAMQAGLALLKPMLVAADVQPAGKVVLGTVKGDLHDIGKNLVGMMMEGAGFEIYDLGTDVTPEKFVEKAKAVSADVVALSALLTTTMNNMEATIKAMDAAGLRGKVKIIIGGAPVTQDYANRIGADGFAPDASQAVRLAKSLIGS